MKERIAILIYSGFWYMHIYIIRLLQYVIIENIRLSNITIVLKPLLASYFFRSNPY